MWAESWHKPGTQQGLREGGAGMVFQREGQAPPHSSSLGFNLPSRGGCPGVRGWRSPVHLALSLQGPGALLVFPQHLR